MNNVLFTELCIFYVTAGINCANIKIFNLKFNQFTS